MLHRRQFLGVSALISAAIAAPTAAWARIRKSEQEESVREVEEIYDERFDREVDGPNILCVAPLRDQRGHTGGIYIEKTPAIQLRRRRGEPRAGSLSNTYRVTPVFVLLGMEGTPQHEAAKAELQVLYDDLRPAIRAGLRVRDLALESGKWRKDRGATTWAGVCGDSRGPSWRHGRPA